MRDRHITKTPILPCRGGLCEPERPARHRFVRLEDKSTGGVVTDVEAFYRCDECGHERVWGTFDPVLLAAPLLH